jgi:hypothetical protein
MGTTISPTSYGPPAPAAPTDLAERLRDPATQAAVHGLLDRVDRLNHAIDALSAVAARAPAAVAMITDVADDAAAGAAARGVVLDERLRQALGLAERLYAPRTIAVLSALLDRVDAVERLLAAADAAPGFVAMAVDIADDAMRDAQASGLDVERGLAQGAGAAIRLGSMMGAEQVASIEAVMRSGLLDPRTVRVVGGIGRALTAASIEEPPRVGLLGLLRALRDPDVQRALGLLLGVAAGIGQELSAPGPLASPSATSADRPRRPA